MYKYFLKVLFCVFVIIKHERYLNKRVIKREKTVLIKVFKLYYMIIE